MNADTLAYALLAGLAIGLIFSLYTDIRYRLIYNKVTASIALVAPVFWYATGSFLPAEIGIHLLVGALTFIFFTIAFRFGAMGGGDVKLFAALALWFPWLDVIRLILYA
ncbi:MAG: prepilin peptidase, partial [Sphingorhabdus sp.]